MNTVPIYEAKNKLPLFMHQAEESGPIFISRRNQTVGVLLSINEYKRIIANGKKDSILDRAAEFRRKTAELLIDKAIDNIFDDMDKTPDDYGSHVWDGVFD